MECRICKKNFHYCSSCNGDNYLDNGYCSKECFEKSQEYDECKKIMSTLYNSLDFDNKINLWALWDNGFLEDPLFEELGDGIFLDPRKD